MADTNRTGPLAGVRVLDLTSGPGRYAGRCLAEMGADVVRLAPLEDPGPSLAPAAEGGLLSWWYDVSCRSVALDLSGPDGPSDLVRLAERADVFIEDTAPGTLEALGVGPAALAARNPALVQVSLSPFGATGPRAAWHTSDLVSQALGGYLSVTGDEDHPVALWGRQSAVVGGLYAAASALAGLRRARLDGTGTWIDLSLHEAIVSCTEHLFMYWWFPEALAALGAPIARRQRSLHWIRAFEVVPCQRGACMVSPAAGGLLGLIAWLKARGHATEVPDEPAEDQLLALIPALMTALKAAALECDATELFEAGQALHVPFGEAYAIDQVARCPQHLHRRFFRPVAGHDRIRIPGPVARFSASPGPEPAAPAPAVSADAVLATWTPRSPTGGGDRAAGGPPAGSGDHRPDDDRRPLAGLRVLDFTHVLAGPFATRIMGDLGADVIRIQTEERSAGSGANEFPYNVLWARNKRAIQLSMRHDEALDVLRRLVEQADVVIENFSAGVLASWGAGPEELARWNPGIITVAMSGCGADGPWSPYVTYAPTIHALSGFTALTGPEGESDCGPGIAYNDHISGLVAAGAVLAAVDHRHRTGQGQHVECSQFEVGTSLVGPALVDHFATGRVARSQGNRDPFSRYLVNDVFPTADARWLAVTVDTEACWNPAAEALGLHRGAAAGPAPTDLVRTWAATRTAAEGAEALQALGVAAGMVADASDLTGHDPQLRHREVFRSVDSEMLGLQHLERFPGRFHPGAGAALELSYRASPFLGQHNFEVYGQLLGWDEARVAQAMGEDLVF